MQNGFSARSIDTKYITPTLNELGLPAMAESGWLTRSLEQPYPYTMNYQGEISGVGMKQAFLRTVNYFQEDEELAEPILRILLNSAINYREANKVEITKIATDDDIQISEILNILRNHFFTVYGTHGGSKLPVLAFYAVYTFLVNEMSRYNGAELLPLGSHTASDRTSNSSGDIEIAKAGEIFEAVEVKLDKAPDLQMVRVAYGKITKFNPERYYILSGLGIVPIEQAQINELISTIQTEHGCQLIIDGLYNSLDYYLRLVANPKQFLNRYIELVMADNELSVEHKERLKEILEDRRITL
jgi:DNA (cytosine-5)-methyltransferase 1